MPRNSRTVPRPPSRRSMKPSRNAAAQSERQKTMVQLSSVSRKRAMAPPKLQNSADRKTSRKPRRSSRCELLLGSRWRRRIVGHGSAAGCSAQRHRPAWPDGGAPSEAASGGAGEWSSAAQGWAHWVHRERPLFGPLRTRSLEIEGAETGHHLVEAERTRDRRLGAGQAADALAEPAGRADRRRPRLRPRGSGAAGSAAP